MLFGLRHSYLSKFYGFFLFLPMFVFLFDVKRHISMNNKSHFLSQDVLLALVKEFSSQLFVLMTFKLK